METKKQLTIEKVDDYHYTIPKQGGMQVPGLLYANQKLIDDIKRDESPRQVANVAHCPESSTIHWLCRTCTGVTDFLSVV